jgi:hypothetical protein
MKIIIKPLAIILTSTLLLGQIKTGQSTTKIAYAGIQIDNVEPWVKEDLIKKMGSIFEDINPDQFISTQTVQNLAQSELKQLFMEISDSSFQKISDKTGAKYVFAGKFKNVSPDDRRIMIQGEFYRYNAELKSKFRYEVLKYYERMNDEATIIKKQLVDSIPATASPATFKQVGILFGLILVIGLLFMSMAGTSVWGEGSGASGLPSPTEN